MKFEIKARAYAGGHVLFTAELDAKYESEPQSVQLGAAVKAAVKARANLAGAYLAGAYLARANLARANLADAYLARANLADAYLADANLADAYLADANLARANLEDANLADANLARANLEDANLAGANLAGAYLADAYLADANLADANLADANLARANLARANLAGARSEPAAPEEIARLDQVREIVLARPERLEMRNWHSGAWDPSHTPEEEHSCGSAHCIAGWLQALCPDEEMRQHRSAEYVGKMLAPASAHMFYTSDAIALQWLKDRGYARQPEPKAA